MMVHGFDLGKRGFRPVELPVCGVGRLYGSGKLDPSSANLLSGDALLKKACFMPFRVTGTGIERVERVERKGGFSGDFGTFFPKMTSPKTLSEGERVLKGWERSMLSRGS